MSSLSVELRDVNIKYNNNSNNNINYNEKLDQRHYKYIRFLYLPLVILITITYAIPLARLSFAATNNSRWYAGLYFFILTFPVSLVVMIVYRTAFFDSEGKPIMSLKLSLKYYLLLTVPNAALSFLRFAYIPDDFGTSGQSFEDASYKYHLCDSIYWICNVVTFFILMPYVHYRHYHQYCQKLNYTYNNGVYQRIDSSSSIKDVNTIENNDISKIAIDLIASGGSDDLKQRDRDTKFSYMTPFVIICILFTLLAIILQRHNLLNFSAIGVIMVLVWGIILYLDRNYDSNAGYLRRPDAAYLIMVAFSSIILPIVCARLFWQALKKAHGEPVEQVFTVLVWNIFMITFVVLTRRTIRTAYRLKKGTAFAFIFAIQFFDDSFAALAYLEFKTFDVAFFILLLWHMINDFMRDSGIRSDLWFWFQEKYILKDKIPLEERIALLCEQMRVTDQNFTSEIIAILMVPAVLGYDNILNTGVDSISCGTGDSLLRVVLGYLVLLASEFILHIFVRKYLDYKHKRLQILAVLDVQSKKPPLQKNSRDMKSTRSVKARESLMTQLWSNFSSVLVRHWKRQLVFFVAVCAAAMLQGIFVVSRFRHEGSVCS